LIRTVHDHTDLLQTCNIAIEVGAGEQSALPTTGAHAGKRLVQHECGAGRSADLEPAIFTESLVRLHLKPESVNVEVAGTVLIGAEDGQNRKSTRLDVS